VNARWFDGANDIPWSNAAHHDAVFGGITGTVALAEPITANALYFPTGAGYSIASNTLTLAGGVVSNAAGVTIGSCLVATQLLKQGAGTLYLSATNTSGLAGAAVRVAAGILELARYGTNASPTPLPATIALTVDAGATLQGFASNVGNLSQTVASLRGAGTIKLNRTSGIASFTLNNTDDSAFAGPMLPSPNEFQFTKNGTGSFTMSGKISTSRNTAINAGTMILAGPNGMVSNNSATAANRTLSIAGGAALILDNTGYNATNRLSDNLTVNLDGGELISAGSAGADSYELTGTLEPNNMHSILTLLPGAAGGCTLEFDKLGSRASLATLLFRGADAGTLKFTIPPSGANLIGGGGSGPRTSIVPYALGATNAAGLGEALVTYDTNTGVRLLAESEFADYAAAAPDMNVIITAGGAITGKTVNALRLDNVADSGYSVSHTGDLNLTSGTLLFSGSNSIALTRATGSAIVLTNTVANVFVLGPGEMSLNSPLVFTDGGGLAKSGTGTLLLRYGIGFSTNPAAAPVYINQGVLKQGAASVAGGSNPKYVSGKVTLAVNYGAVLDLNGFALNMPNNSLVSVAAGGIIRNGSTNATIKTGDYGGVSTVNGLILDGTPGDGSASGLVSLSHGNQQAYWVLSHGGHTLNNLTQTDNLVYNNQMTLYSLHSADHNTVHGAVAVTTGRLRLYTTADRASSAVGFTIGSAPITIGNANSELQVWSRSPDLPLTAANTLAWSNRVTVNASGSITVGRWDTASYGVTHRFGDLSIGAYTLTVNATNGYRLAFAGTQTLTGNAGFNVASGTLLLNAVGETGSGRTLTMTGAGTLVLAGTNTYTGLTTVDSGTLAGTFRLLGALATGGNGGTLAPGEGTNGATVSAGSLVLSSNSTFRVNINGTAPSQYDRLLIASNSPAANGTVILSNAVLDVALGCVPPRGYAFLIIDNDQADPVSGAFAGLPNQSLFSVSNGAYVASLIIDYAGGDGNDVVLRAAGNAGAVLLLR
jgi:autotransporter-associated beta strand protein